MVISIPTIWYGYIYTYNLVWLYLYLQFSMVISIPTIWYGYIYTYNLVRLYLYLQFGMVISIPTIWYGYIYTYNLEWLYLYLQFGIVISIPTILCHIKAQKFELLVMHHVKVMVKLRTHPFIYIFLNLGLDILGGLLLMLSLHGSIPFVVVHL